MLGIQRHIIQIPTSGPSLIVITKTATGTWDNPYTAPNPYSIWTGTTNSVVANATWSGRVVGTIKNIGAMIARDVDIRVTGNSDPNSSTNQWLNYYYGTINEGVTASIDQTFTFNTNTSGALTPRSFLYISQPGTLQYNLTITLTQTA